MEYKEFVSLVAQMRANQKTYFKTRAYDVLNESKRLERLVDKAIADFSAPKDSQLDFGI